MPPKKRAAPADAVVADKAVENAAKDSDNSAEAQDSSSSDEASPSKRGRGRPKGTIKLDKPVKEKTGRGRGRPPLTEEEKAKRAAERAMGKTSPSKTGKPVGRPKKVDK